jgi:hypothetical protein
MAGAAATSHGDSDHDDEHEVVMLRPDLSRSAHDKVAACSVAVRGIGATPAATCRR